jgi:hypothetical protein
MSGNQPDRQGSNKGTPLAVTPLMLVPGAFMLSFFGVLIGSDRSPEFARWAMPIFGFGWLMMVVWLGMLQK